VGGGGIRGGRAPRYLKPPSRVVPRTRPEGIRWFRSDGSPNWSQRIREREGDARRLASRPPVNVYKSTPILEATERIAGKRVRGLTVIDGKEALVGVLLATDLVNYLGGGEYYNIIVNRHKDNIYYALRKETVSSIMNPTPTHVPVDATLREILEVMVGGGIGFLPVTLSDGTVYGVITERDVIAGFADSEINRKVEEVMTSTIVTVEPEAPIKRAAELMARYGFRRLPVVSGDTGEVKGMISAKDYVSFFGSHEAFKHTSSGSMEEVLQVPVYIVMTPEFYSIPPEASVSDAIKAMLSYGTDYLLIQKGDEVLGIVTERDLLVAIALEEI